MRRIVALLALSLTAVVLVTVLTGAAASASSSQSANTTTEDGSHAFTSALVPDLGPMVEPTIGGIAPGGFPWVLTEGHATLTQSGRLEASVEGLLFGPGAPPPLPGTTGPLTSTSRSRCPRSASGRSC